MEKLTIEDFKDFKDSLNNPNTIPMICEAANRFNALEGVINPVTNDIKKLYVFISAVMCIVEDSNFREYRCDEAMNAFSFKAEPLTKGITIISDSPYVSEVFIAGCLCIYLGQSGASFIKVFGGSDAKITNSWSDPDLMIELIKIVSDICRGGSRNE